MRSPLSAEGFAGDLVFQQRVRQVHNGVGFSIPAHVRRAGNAGVGFKPLFSAVPLTDAEDRLQDQQGETALLARHRLYNVNPLEAKRWFEEKANGYRERWLESLPTDHNAIVRAWLRKR